MYLRWFVQNCLTNRDGFLRILRGMFSRWSRQKHFVDLFIFKYASYSISLQICYKCFLSYNSGRKQMTRQLGSFFFNLHGQTFKDTGAKMLQLIDGTSATVITQIALVPACLHVVYLHR